MEPRSEALASSQPRFVLALVLLQQYAQRAGRGHKNTITVYDATAAIAAHSSSLHILASILQAYTYYLLCCMNRIARIGEPE